MAIGKVKCQHCDKTFVGTARAKYCSTNCKVKAFNKRKREESKK